MRQFARLLGLVVAIGMLPLSNVVLAQVSRSGAGLAAVALPNKLVVGILANGGPLEEVREGKLTGFTGDLLQRLLGSPYEIESRTFTRQDEIQQAACDGAIDLMLNAVPRPRFDQCLVYSAPYLERPAALVARRDDTRVAEPDFIGHAVVAIEAGSPWIDELYSRYPGIGILEVPSVIDALVKVAGGGADAYVGAVPYLRKPLLQSRFQTLTMVRRLNTTVGAYRFAGPLRSAKLIRDLDEHLATLPQSVLDELRDTWLSGDSMGEASTELELTAAERAALAQHPVLRFAVPILNVPYAQEENANELSGLTNDYLFYLGKLLGVKLQYVHTSGMSDAYERLANGDIDVIAGPYWEPGIGPAMRRAGAYASVPMVIVTSAQATYVTNLAGLRGQRVVVVAGSPTASMIRARLPAVDVVDSTSDRDGLALVAAGKADAMVGNLVTMDALIRASYAGELRIAGAAGFDEEVGLLVGARLAPLESALRRAIAVMPESARSRVESRWQHVTYRFDVPWQVLWQYSWPFALAAFLTALGFLVSYLRMRDEVRRRRLTEARLEHELALKHALLAALPEPVAAKDAEGRFVDLNLAFEKFSRLPRQALIGRHLSEINICPAGAAAKLARVQEEALATMHARQCQVQIENAGGLLRTLLHWAVPFRHGDGAPAGLVTTYVDVTEILDVRERAMQLEQRLNDITDSLPVIVYQARRLKMPNGATWEIVYAAGGGGARSLGLDPDALTGPHSALVDGIHPGDSQELLARWERADRSGAPVEIECRLCGANGIRWVSIRAVPRLHDSEVVWNGVVVDVTESRTQAQALREAKELAEAALRIKESFLAMMSHEIRTPMNGILGLIELLQRTDLNAEQRRMVELMWESGRSLGQILDDILDYAKIDAGRLSITPAPLDLRELFDGILGSLLPQAYQKGLRLKQFFSAAVPAKVEIDGIRLRQILFNLLGNAIKFTDAGSVSLIATIQENGSHQKLVVSVVDSGIGIAREDMGKLFAPFVQSERSSTRKLGGTGLGLAIARKLAGLMGGDLTLQSEEGLGTTAELRVPCQMVKQRYDLPVLKGRALWVGVQEPGLRDALIAYGQAAGMQMVDTVQALPEDGIAISESGMPTSKGHVLRLNSELLPLGFRKEAEMVWLGINPLRWSAFVGALETLLMPEKAEPAAARISAERQGAEILVMGPRILVVEDHAINREVIQHQLRLLGYRCVACTNGQEALDALHGDVFDLVLTDCHMPVIDGYDLTRAIRAHESERIRAIPVVGLTATIVREEHLLCTKVGMTELLIKPATLDSLRSTLRKALKQTALELPLPMVEEPAALKWTDGLDASSDFHVERIDVGELRLLLNELLRDSRARKDFRRCLEADRDALQLQLAGLKRQALETWCHRAGGALSQLGQPYLGALVRRLKTECAGGQPLAVQYAGASLLAMYEYLLTMLDELNRSRPS